jgi:putative transposase
MTSAANPASTGVPSELAGLTEIQRVQAITRFAVLRPHLEDDVSLARAAEAAGVPMRTAQRWLAGYHARGLAGLVRPLSPVTPPTTGRA